MSAGATQALAVRLREAAADWTRDAAVCWREAGVDDEALAGAVAEAVVGRLAAGSDEPFPRSLVEDLERAIAALHRGGRGVDDVCDDLENLGAAFERGVASLAAGPEGVIDERLAFELLVRSKRVIRAMTGLCDAYYDAWERRVRDERIELLQTHGRALAHEVRNRIGAAETALLMVSESDSEAVVAQRDRIYQLVLRSLTAAGESVEDVRLLSGVADLSGLPRVRPVPLFEVARRTLQDYQGAARDAGVEVSLEGRSEARVDGGVARLALNNVIGNAIKFHDTGKDERRVHVALSEPDDSCVLVRVTDNGIGIPAAHLDRVFERSVRLATDREGSGLGLALVRSALERIGGEVSIESVQGEHTTVSVRLPRSENDA